MTHEIQVNGWKIGFKDVIQAGVALVALISVYFAFNNRVHNIEEKAEIAFERANKMDEAGTRKSHETDRVQQQQIEFNSAQIQDIQKALRDLGPKVDKIDTNVLWLMAKQLERK